MHEEVKERIHCLARRNKSGRGLIFTDRDNKSIDEDKGVDYNQNDVQYTMYHSTSRGSSLAVNDCTMDVRVMSDRPSTP